MAEVREFTLPDLGEGLTGAEIVRWLVRVGDVVAVDQPVVEVETAKATVDLPCPYGGVVTACFGREGTELPVGAPLLTVAVPSPEAAVPGPEAGEPGPGAGEAGGRSAGEAGAPGEPGPGGGAGPGRRDGPEPERREEPGPGRREDAEPGEEPRARPPGSGNVLVGYGTGALGTRRRRARGGRRRPGSEVVPVVSPLVRRLARERGLDLRDIAGTGPDGLVLRADVERAARSAAVGAGPSAPSGPSAPVGPVGPSASAGPATAAGLPDEGGSGGRAASEPTGTGSWTGHAGRPGPAGERVPLRGIRGAAADKLVRSRREIPDATCWVDADATALLAARTAVNAAEGPRVSLLALLARICTAALARHPELNATVDTERREVVRLPAVHLGFAVQSSRGLVVPVVRDAHARDLAGLSAELARLTEAARTGTLTPAELTGGTFTLNNYGVFGVDGSTPIINHPEAAMLGVGRIAAKPWVHEGELAVRQVVQLSFTFDHRVCDGAVAGGFLRCVADHVENPALLLRTL
ncbi:2-oxo acid dehydrogenase subunit E2 [Streptomyces sp. B1866]|uniref:dihydrolipoamide acetyltransferase family protein n=1 Tax=Streptomyces sp. B1866 TaxID=3075431 RepID=UPI00288F3015|nr:2-oxo acid dehydrogenase subunit E2 [Streptomyces sp. B1866]MDT3397659.1 2-oxo acid dehydrogenase subunit E2 [Streptomyces sp. B1866]